MTMRRWVKVRFGLTFLEPADIEKYVKGLKNQDPQNRQAALSLILAWLNLKMGSIMNSYATDENASEKTATALEDIISYLAKGWDKGILDFSEKETAAIKEPQATTPAPVPQATVAQAAKANSIDQATKVVKANYSTKPVSVSLVGKKTLPGYASKKKAVAYQDLKSEAMKQGRIKL